MLNIIYINDSSPTCMWIVNKNLSQGKVLVQDYMVRIEDPLTILS